jgi:hypothetical protein
MHDIDYVCRSLLSTTLTLFQNAYAPGLMVCSPALRSSLKTDISSSCPK